MKAPNKLFMKPENIRVEMIPGGELPNVGIQYIRKDLLLDWAKEQSASCDSAGAMKRAYDKLIDKLNSL